MQKSAAERNQSWTIRRLILWATDYLRERGIDSPRLTAEVLLGGALGCSRLDLYLQHAKPLEDAELQRFKQLLLRRARREPLAYITGFREFWSLEFKVTPAVLIPRPETECLVESVLGIIDRFTGEAPRRILELGTGSGAVAVALAKERPRHFYVATDRSPAALEMAVENARRHDVAERIKFVCADWFSAFAAGAKRFDLIAANPPYIPSGELARLAPEIFEHEPLQALDGAEDGLACIRQIVAAAPALLNAGGRLLIEIGHDQRDALLRLTEASGGYTQTTFCKDLGGHDRVAVLHKK